MHSTQDPPKRGFHTKIALLAKPYMLAKPLVQVLSRLDKRLFESSMRDIRFTYKMPHRMYKTTKDLGCIYSGVNPTAIKEAQYYSTIKRALLTSLWYDVVKEVIAGGASACANEVIRGGYCPPMGFASNKYACRNSMCPNCYMRDVAMFYKELKELKLFEKQQAGFVVKLQVPFTETMYGQDCEAINFAQLDLRATLGSKVQSQVSGKTLGAWAEGSTALLCTNYFCTVEQEKQEPACRRLKAKLNKMMAESNNMRASLTMVQNEDDLCANMFDHCPFSLITLYSSDLSNLSLHYTVESYRTKVANKKSQQIF